MNFKEKFTFRKNSHFARYYKEIDVCYVWNGLHSVGMGVYRGEGELKANQVSLEKAFPHMDTAGENWINVHTGETLMKVHDFRIAILYELAKMSNSIKE